MIKSLMMTCVAVLLMSGPVSAEEQIRKRHGSANKKPKVETGASCKAPPVGRCSSCAIACPPGETATCAPGQIAVEMCATQASCRCSSR